ncbi:MAG: metallophosphoesterase [Abditibacteriota bacterium]|nr:metallophosphoesterase [Abditibacteriota bacterium]
MKKTIFAIFLFIILGSVLYSQTMAELNPGFEDLLTAAMRPHNRTANEYMTNIKPLVLFHFSDIHGDKLELERYVEFLGTYGKYFDDAICTGDLVELAAEQGFNYWGEVKGAEKILFVLGNHDFIRKWAGENWNDRLSKKELWNQYFAKYIKNWNVNYIEGNPYYYKDYPEKRFRLIGLDCSFKGEDDAEQLAWYKDVLKGAREMDYYVITAFHYHPGNSEQIKCNFTEVDHQAGSEPYAGDMTEYYKAVEEFKAEGGKFVLWLCGHTHWEQFAYPKAFPTQLHYSIDATNRFQSMMYGNMTRKDGTRSQDLANALIVDTTTKTLKIIRIGANVNSYLVQRNGITLNYETYEILSQF